MFYGLKRLKYDCFFFVRQTNNMVGWTPFQLCSWLYRTWLIRHSLRLILAKWKIVLSMLIKIIILFCVSQVQITCVIHSMHIYCNVITISMITYSRLLALLQLYIVRTNIVSLVSMLNCGWNMTSRNDRFKWTNDEIGFNAAKWDLPPPPQPVDLRLYDIFGT